VLQGFGGIISFEMNSKASARELVESTKIFIKAVSLGGVESLISHPAGMTHGDWAFNDEVNQSYIGTFPVPGLVFYGGCFINSFFIGYVGQLLAWHTI